MDAFHYGLIVSKRLGQSNVVFAKFLGCVMQVELTENAVIMVLGKLRPYLSTVFTTLVSQSFEIGFGTDVVGTEPRGILPELLAFL